MFFNFAENKMWNLTSKELIEYFDSLQSHAMILTSIKILRMTLRVGVEEQIVG